VLTVALFSGGAGLCDAVADGARVFQARCAVCHATAPEFHKEGPSLAGVYGRRAGAAPFFANYRGLRGATFIWNEQSLDRWLADPRGFLAGRDTTMTERLADPVDRANVIAFLKTLR
jgi:cytochrome c